MHSETVLTSIADSTPVVEAPPKGIPDLGENTPDVPVLCPFFPNVIWLVPRSPGPTIHLTSRTQASHACACALKFNTSVIHPSSFRVKQVELFFAFA